MINYNDENNNNNNVRVFNTPIKNGSKKMTWNSPFQPLVPTNQESTIEPCASTANKLDSFTDFSCTEQQFDPQSALYLPPEFSDLTNNFNTDIPVLDSLFSELNNPTNNNNNNNVDIFSDLNNDFGIKSEPVNLEDIERILLPAQTTRKIRQPFTSILNSFTNLPTGPFDTPNNNPMLWDGNDSLFNTKKTETQQPQTTSSVIPLTSQASQEGGKILVKVIGKRDQHGSQSLKNAEPTIKQVPYIPAPIHSKPTKSYRTYGKKRYIIGPEYADFVCRLQNDIPFDSSEDDEEFSKESTTSQIDDDDNYTGDENDPDDLDDLDEEESEEEEEVKISPKELLELFEDSCSGLPGLISAYLTHKKHQIGLKGYKPRVPTPKTSSSLPPLLSQSQFDRIEGQLKLHFQFLIQNLALSNEIEGGEGVTLMSLKLLVQLHLHLDSICNLKAEINSINDQSSPISAVSTMSTLSSASISCLNVPNRRVNPIKSRLNELIPPGIKKVAIIAGFLVRPGQKQFLSLSALRQDSSLKPKTCPSTPPLPFKVKPVPSGQMLSNAFYNIIALFHDYIDPKLLEMTVGATNLAKYLENETASNCGSGITSTRTAKFLASEDNLLLCGLLRFGCGNWESIQAQFLPYRTSRQLAIRYKNLSSRREPLNPIKEFNERLMQPLNEIEEDLLYKGVQRFGNQFHLISKHFLPHRPATVLGKLWKAMDDARRI